VAANDHDGTTIVAHGAHPVAEQAWRVSEVGLEDLVLAYLSRGRSDGSETTQ
jgi:hypothetical protein